MMPARLSLLRVQAWFREQCGPATVPKDNADAASLFWGVSVWVVV